MTRQAKESERLTEVDAGKGHKQLAQLVGEKTNDTFLSLSSSFSSFCQNAEWDDGHEGKTFAVV